MYYALGKVRTNIFNIIIHSTNEIHLLLLRGRLHTTGQRWLGNYVYLLIETFISNRQKYEKNAAGYGSLRGHGTESTSTVPLFQRHTVIPGINATME